MRNYLILIPIFLLAVFQGAFLPLNLVLLLVLGWAIIRPIKEAFIIALLAGLFLDLAKGSPLGFSSFLFLVITYLLRLYSRRFDPAHPVFLFLYTFLVSTLSNLFFQKPWLWESLVLAVLSLLLRPMIRYYLGDLGRGEIKLKIQ